MQAGQMQGRIFHSMGSALRNGGIGALYSGHTAFLMQGLPYDVAELVTYSQLRAIKGPLKDMPAEFRDMLIGEQHLITCPAAHSALTLAGVTDIFRLPILVLLHIEIGHT